MAAGALPSVNVTGGSASPLEAHANPGDLSGSTSTVTTSAGGGGPTSSTTASTANPNGGGTQTPTAGSTSALTNLQNIGTHSGAPTVNPTNNAFQSVLNELSGAGVRDTYNPTGLNVAGGGGGLSGNASTLINDAKSWIGTPYVYGGTGRSGVDCSGFTQAVYAQMGMNIGRDTSAQFASGQRVGVDGNWNASVQALQPGDLIFYGQPGASGPNAHVVMYIGNGQIIQAAHTGTNVAIGNLFSAADASEPFLGVRRYLQPQASPGVSTSPGASNGGYTFGTQQNFADDLLSLLGDPTTSANVNSIVNWENREGGNWHNSASYNPLNTTQTAAGSHVMGGGNSAGVQAYTSWLEGLNATAQTLRNGRYGDILSALSGGGGLGGYLSGLGTWSGGGYYSV